MAGIFINKKKWDDKKLLKIYCEKEDKEALGILYDRYLHLVYGLCLKYLKDREQSQDAVMDIYEKISVSICKHDVSYFKSWLYTLSRNHCLMILRKQNPESGNEIFMENIPSPHPNDELELENQLQLMEKCIEELKNGQKECIKLFYLKEKSYKEIEQHSDFSLNEIKSYIQNGKRNLKKCMDRGDE